MVFSCFSKISRGDSTVEINKQYNTIDLHIGGQPLRIVTGGLPFIQGVTQWERMEFLHQYCSQARKLLMLEPRGHYGMCGCVVTAPSSHDAHFGLLFIQNNGVSTMSGHGIIGAATAWIELGYLELVGSLVRIDTPAGRITASVVENGNEVTSVTYINVPSFVYELNFTLLLEGLEIKLDIAFGGAFYALVESSSLNGLSLEESELSVLQKWGVAIKSELNRKLNVIHPQEPKLCGIHGVSFINSQSTSEPNSAYRMVTVFAEGQFDRSPCGAAASAHMAVLLKQGKLKAGEALLYEGIIGTQIKASVEHGTKLGEYQAVIPSITGSACLTGFHQFVVDPTDPYAEGFLLR